MSNNNTKAIVATVKLGEKELEGLMLPDGSYRMGVSQVTKILPNSVPKNRSLKELKALTGLDFQSPLKVKSELNPKAVNALKIEDIVSLIEWAAFDKGDKDARALAKALMQEPLERRFDYAFNKRQSEKEYNRRLETRKQGKEANKDLNNSIADYIDRHDIKGAKADWYYKHVKDKLYYGLTGIKSTKKVREKYDIPTKVTPRNYCTTRDLLVISQVESLAQRWIDDYDIEPCKAVDDAVDRLYVRNIGLKRESRLV